MAKLNSFKYKDLVFHNTTDNFFQTKRFGNKLVYELRGDRYHLIVDNRLSNVIGIDEVTRGTYHSDDNNWK